jgi:maltose alpha-D-glucosyltransferase / alpha-amylase
VIDAPLPRAVLAHRFDAPAGSILLLHNLADTTVTVDIGAKPSMNGNPYDLFVGSHPGCGPSSRYTAVPRQVIEGRFAAAKSRS